jgi:hypothetical protein
MDAYGYVRGTFLERAFARSTNLRARHIGRADKEWENQRVVRLLRRTEVPALRSSGFFHRVDCALTAVSRQSTNALVDCSEKSANAPEYLRMPSARRGAALQGGRSIGLQPPKAFGAGRRLPRAAQRDLRVHIGFHSRFKRPKRGQVNRWPSQGSSSTAPQLLTCPLLTSPLV